MSDHCTPAIAALAVLGGGDAVFLTDKNGRRSEGLAVRYRRCWVGGCPAGSARYGCSGR